MANMRRAFAHVICIGAGVGLLLASACAPAAAPQSTAAKGQPAQPAASARPLGESDSIDVLYEKAKKEGTVVFYGTLAQVNAEKILPEFEKRFPGVKVEHVDATSDKLVARAVAEARGGKVLGDVWQTPMDTLLQVREQGLMMDYNPPEAADYPDNLKGSYWIASDSQFFIIAWNTNLVKKEDEPKGFEDLADPKWKGKLIAEPRDHDMLAAFAKYKYQDEQKAVDLVKRIAANQVEFHKGHSELAELLVAGQAAVCWTCYSHHYPSRIKKGAPLNYLLTEGVGNINGTAIFKDAPHPYAAMLFARWISSEEGQKAYAAGGRTPAHPKVEPVDKTRPEKIYPITVEDQKEMPKYEKLWKEIFQLR